MENIDFNVDMFLIFEELQTLVGKELLTAKKDLGEFLHIKRQPFIKCFHLIAVHPTAQVYLARDLHNTVHGGLLRPGVELFLQAITTLGFHHVYYAASVKTHVNHFLRILNGSAAS